MFKTPSGYRANASPCGKASSSSEKFRRLFRTLRRQGRCAAVSEPREQPRKPGAATLQFPERSTTITRANV